MYFSNFSPPPPIGRMNIQFLIDATGTNVSGSIPLPYDFINAQTGTSYPIDPSDLDKLVTFTNPSPVAVSLSDPTTPPPNTQTNGNFDAGWQCLVLNLGAGLVTITTNSTLIGGSATLQLAQYQGATIISDGANWQVFGLNITNLAATGPGGVSGILQTANGGTGTASPSPTAGTGISITGTWPNNTITNTAPAPATSPFLIAYYLPGLPTASLTFYVDIPANLSTVSFPANFANSKGKCGTNPTATATYNFQQNGSTVGTIVISTSGTFTFATTGGLAITVAASDELSIVAPSSPDATLANVRFTIAGTR